MRRKDHVAIALIAALGVIATLALGPVAATGGRTFDLALSSSAEVPLPNDVASGTAEISINPGLQRVCFAVTWDDVAGDVTAAHIHRAPAGSTAPPLVPLFGPQPSDGNGDGAVSGCVMSSLSSAELADIVAKPAGYYVNVHSTINGPGAIRAQLSD